jgi:hypothetical protein
MAIQDSMFLTFENWQLIVISQSISKNKMTFEVLLKINGGKKPKTTHSKGTPWMTFMEHFLYSLSSKFKFC